MVFMFLLERFQELFHKDVNDDVIAVLCKYVTFDANSELDFTRMEQELLEAVEYEKEALANREEGERAIRYQFKECSYHIISSLYALLTVLFVFSSLFLLCNFSLSFPSSSLCSLSPFHSQHIRCVQP